MKDFDFSDFARRHRLFPRFFVCLFSYMCWDMNWWLQDMVEKGTMAGSYVFEVYVGAMVGGFVAIVTGYAATGNEPKE